jgi:hypothetical protein
MSLKEKVDTFNKLNADAKILIEQLREWLRPFIGQKVVNADNTLIKKLRDAKPKSDVSCNIGVGTYNLWVYFGYNGMTLDSYLAGIENGVLTELCDIQHVFKSDFTVESLEANKRKVQELKREIEEINHKFCLNVFYPFI